MPPGYAGFGYSNILPDGRDTNSYQLQDNLSWMHGRHTVKAGTNLTYQRSPNIWLPNYNGTYSFATMADYFEDVPASISITQGSPNLDFREHDNFFYVGDDFKATKNLTLNLGLSYAYFGQPANLFNQHDVANETGQTPFFDPSPRFRSEFSHIFHPRKQTSVPAWVSPMRRMGVRPWCAVATA